MVLTRADLSIRVARVLAPVTVLGPGRRVGLWVQGCGLRCVGCASADTWDPTGGTSMSVNALADTIARVLADVGADGLTITGGEPTDQGEALAALVADLRDEPRWQGLDVLVFSGRPIAAARRRAARLIASADCVVAGPYDSRRPGVNRLLASDNQTLHLGSLAAAERYQAWLSDDVPALQVVVQDGEIQLVGLPRAGDLDRFRAGLASRGVALGGVSWRS